MRGSGCWGEHSGLSPHERVDVAEGVSWGGVQGREGDGPTMTLPPESTRTRSGCGTAVQRRRASTDWGPEVPIPVVSCVLGKALFLSGSIFANGK